MLQARLRLRAHTGALHLRWTMCGLPAHHDTTPVHAVDGATTLTPHGDHSSMPGAEIGVFHVKHPRGDLLGQSDAPTASQAGPWRQRPARPGTVSASVRQEGGWLCSSFALRPHRPTGLVARTRRPRGRRPRRGPTLGAWQRAMFRMRHASGGDCPAYSTAATTSLPKCVQDSPANSGSAVIFHAASSSGGLGGSEPRVHSVEP